MSEAVGPVRLNFCFPKHWCGCGLSADGGGRGKEGGEEEGGRRGGTFKELEPEFSLSGTVCFSKAY